jgi:cytochrome c2
MRISSVLLLLAGLALLGAAIAGIAWYARYEPQAEEQARNVALTGGDPERGRALFASFGCGGCHALANVPQAHGRVGPPLDGIATRAIIGGRLQNTPDNLARWIGEPQSVSPGTAMPNLGMTRGQARDLAAFLYSRP